MFSFSGCRRKRREWKPDDARELVSVPGVGEMTCQRYRDGGAVPTMQAVDAMPASYRALVHEFGMGVWEMWRAGLGVDLIRARGERKGWL